VTVRRLSANQSTPRTHTTSAAHPRKKDHKIIVIGDSHARGCAATMKEYFSENVEVRDYVKPCVTTDILVKTACNEINGLTKKDAIILWGGSNVVGKNNSQRGLRNILHFMRTNSHTNIILMGVPHRFHLSDSACVNNEVESFNNKLLKIIKPFSFSSLLRIEQRRENFTRHGMHLNATGKALVAKQLVNCVNSILNQKEGKSICMGWKAGPDICTADENKVKQDYSSLDKSNLGNNRSSVNDLNRRKVNCNQVWTSMQDEMSGQVTANLVCSEKRSNPKSTATKPAVNRTSSRIRKAPVTKKDAFLW
jgi:hypothetical protein